MSQNLCHDSCLTSIVVSSGSTETPKLAVLPFREKTKKLAAVLVSVVSV
jgi:hypothetical protein